MSATNIIYLILLLVVVYAVATIVWYTLRNGISPMPTGSRVQGVILNALADIKPEGVIFELGSGWGTLAMGVARQCPDCRVIGFENSPVPFWVSRFLSRIMPAPNLKIEKRDFYDVDLSDADAVFCYLYPGAMDRLRLKFEAELSPGTWVISQTFAVPGWEAEKVIEVSDLYRTKVYVYRV